jgi:hypothetical protein
MTSHIWFGTLTGNNDFFLGGGDQSSVLNPTIMSPIVNGRSFENDDQMRGKGSTV